MPQVGNFLGKGSFCRTLFPTLPTFSVCPQGVFLRVNFLFGDVTSWSVLAPWPSGESSAVGLSPARVPLSLPPSCFLWVP